MSLSVSVPRVSSQTNLLGRVADMVTLIGLPMGAYAALASLFFNLWLPVAIGLAAVLVLGWARHVETAGRPLIPGLAKGNSVPYAIFGLLLLLTCVLAYPPIARIWTTGSPSNRQILFVLALVTLSQVAIYIRRFSAGRATKFPFVHETFTCQDVVDRIGFSNLEDLAENAKASKDFAREIELRKFKVAAVANDYLELYRLGEALRKGHRPREAKAVLQRSIELNPNYFEAKFALAYVLAFQLEEYAEAHRLYQEAAHLTSVQECDCYYDSGICLERLGKPDEARAEFERIVGAPSGTIDDDLLSKAQKHLGRLKPPRST